VNAPLLVPARSAQPEIAIARDKLKTINVSAMNALTDAKISEAPISLPLSSQLNTSEFLH
jgi:hypothetical protein